MWLMKTKMTSAVLLLVSSIVGVGLAWGVSQHGAKDENAGHPACGPGASPARHALSLCRPRLAGQLQDPRSCGVRSFSEGQSGHRCRCDARTCPLLRHPAVGEQHRRLRFLPCAEARLRRSEPLQQGVRGQATDRNATSLVNLRYSTAGRFFWDERAGNLEEAVLMPIQSKIEMGQDLTRLMDGTRPG